TAQWFVAGSPLYQGVHFGGAGSVPVPGDYDGTGKTQIAVFRPATGQWSIGGHAQPIVYGGAHQVPAAAAYAYRALSGPLRIAAARPAWAWRLLMARRADAPHDLLFGLLALQNGMVSQSQLVAAFGAWTLARDRPMADVLVGQGALSEPRRALLEALVAEHLKM